MTLGLASASFCWMASALPQDARAPARSPVCDSIAPMLLWLIATSRWKLGDAGVGVRQFLLDGERLAERAPRPIRVARL